MQCARAHEQVFREPTTQPVRCWQQRIGKEGGNRQATLSGMVHEATVCCMHASIPTAEAAGVLGASGTESAAAGVGAAAGRTCMPGL